MAQNIIRAHVKIRGTKTMLWHAFGPDSIPTEKKEQPGVPGHNPEEWRKTTLITEEGQLYVRPDYVFSTLKNGAQHTKRGLLKLVAATLQIEDEVILIDRWFPGWPNGHGCDLVIVPPPPINAYKLPVYLDVRSVVNPSTKGRNIRYRMAATPGWETEFTIYWDKTIVNRDLMHAVAVDAGTLVGLNNGRAIGLGRFEVVNFDVL